MATPIKHIYPQNDTASAQNVQWEPAHEAILKEWKAKCFVQMWLQIKSGYFYSRLHDMLSYPIIILSSVCGATLFTSSNPILKYMIGAFSISSGVLTAITRQVRPGELYQQYSQTAKRYQMLIRRIQTCLELPSDMRPPVEIFVDKIGTEIDSLSATQLYPPSVILRRFEKTYGYLDQLLFGEDIIELLAKDLKNRKLVKRIAHAK